MLQCSGTLCRHFFCNWRILDGCFGTWTWNQPRSSLAVTYHWAIVPSIFPGRAAICLPNLPSPVISLPTSAALSVLNFSTMPDCGSYVFKTKTARGTFGVEVSLSSSSPSRFRFFVC